MDRYVRAFAPEKIVLFGSYAKGTNQPGSDVDLLIIANLPDNDTSAQLRRAHQLARDCFPPVDTVFASPDEVENAARMQNPFLLSILESGLSIYRRDSPP
jgi:uncharacterized protein